MAAQAELAILLKLRDEATRQLRRAGVSTRSFSADLKKLARNVTIATAALSGMGYGLALLAEEAAKTQTARSMLENLATTAGTTADAVLSAMERSTRGMLSNAQMIVQANRAIAGIGPWFTQELPRAMEAAIAAWKAGGGNFNYYVDSVIRGIGRLQPLILDNLLVQVGVAEATDRFAQSLAEETEELSKAEQQMALYNLFMEKMRPLMDAAAGSAGGFEEDMAALRAEFANAKEAIGTLLIPALRDIVPEVTEVIKAFQLMPVEMQKQALETAGILTALLVAFKAFGIAAVGTIGLPIAAVYLLRKALMGISNLLDPSVESYEALNETFMEFLERNVEGLLGALGLGVEAVATDMVQAYRTALGEVRSEQEKLAALPPPVATEEVEKATVALSAFTAAGEFSVARMAKWTKVEYEQWITSLERSVLANKILLAGLRAGTMIYKDAERNLKGLEGELALVKLEYELLYPAMEKAAKGTKVMAMSQNELISALVSSHPLVMSLSASITGLETNLAGAEAAQRSMQAAMHEASRAYARAQENVSRLSQELSKARQRLDELARPRLVGMGALEEETRRVEDYINRLKLARLMGRPMPVEAGLPASIKALERMLEILRLRRAVEFDPLLRELEEAARPKAEEITFEEALREIEKTRKTITSLEGQVALANAALRAQKNSMDALQEASWGLSQSIAAVRDLLAQEKAKRDLVIEGLKVALGWFIKDRDELIKTGKITEAEATRIDRNMMLLFDTFTLTAEGKAVTTVNHIRWIVRELEDAVRKAKAAGQNLGGGGATGFAAGRRALRGGLAVVGERGPELVNLPKGAEVYPQTRLRTGLSGATLVLNIHGDIYGMDDFRERVREAVERGKQRGWRV